MTLPEDDGVWIGLDLGTQSVRALAVTGQGVVVGMGSAPLTSRRDGNRHEQDPRQWWAAVSVAARAALADVAPASVQGVAVDATSGTVLLVDETGEPVTPGVMYDDTRAAPEVEQVNDVGAATWAALGYQRMQPAWALPKLLWLLRHHPGATGAHRLAHQSDVINRRLVGHEVPTDLSNALKTGAHLVNGEWPVAVLDALGVPGELLPPLVRPGTRLGAVCAAAGEQTGIPVGTPVFAGMTDGCAAQLGSGALRVGSWNSVLGTTLVLKGVAREPVHDPAGVVYSHRGPNDTWLPGGASSTGAGAVSRDFPGGDLDALNRAAASHEPANAVCYPLVSTGERFPFVAPRARGFLVGEPAGEADRFAAVLQGVAYVERLCFDYLHLLGAPLDGDLVLTGGATRSGYWNQLRADILGRPVVLPENAEPALGMAILAAAADRDPVEVAAAMVRVRAVVEPRAGSHSRFTPGYLRLVEMLEHRGWLPSAAAAHARERTAQ
ncbi:FGGY-family carbohydrate kinase [Micromonospora inositola]|uniref:Sugar (Pentulose or hexulose) kinase n=1 Tax=Micromonospora inositola TaxID=47865 RepID=A0A1C5JCQ6_9ACTN|nr:FGGY family carbohydrate kinase [Micromonospora inositola]SCG67806.1 Sugar (pentulose or hexulose) kinase [Micromonospora inositola]